MGNQHIKWRERNIQRLMLAETSGDCPNESQTRTGSASFERKKLSEPRPESAVAFAAFAIAGRTGWRHDAQNL
jgi:hypothetical protein